MNQPITYSSEITLSLAKFNNIYLYSDGFMKTELELNSFHKLHGNLFNDFKNAVFKVLPVTNFQWTEKVLIDVVKDNFARLSEQKSVKDRKAMVLGYISNLEGEVNSNISVSEKMKGTPLVFGSSQFHLVHVSSFKFLSLNDDNIENLFFELVDFPCQGSILKFVPCLEFQKLRTNSVFHGDPVIISSAKLVCNRAPQLCSTYKGSSYDEQMANPGEYNLNFQKELMDTRSWASVEELTRWRVNAFYAVGQNDRGKLSEDNIYVGDVITMNLSEMNRYLNVLKPYDTFTQIFEILNKEEEEYNIQEAEAVQGTQETGAKTKVNKTTNKKPNLNEQQLRKQKENIIEQSVFQNDKKKAPEDKVILKRLLKEDAIIAFQDIQSQDDSNHVSKTMAVIPNSCYWKIEAELFKEGGKVEWNKKYRLRHFQSGRYLRLKEDHDKVIAELTSEASSQTLFKFCSIQNTELNQGKSLWKDSFFYFLHWDTQKYLGITDSDEVQASDIIKKTQKQLDVNLNGLYLSLVQNHFNTFRIRRIEFQDTWETSMLLYSIPFFIEAINFINQLNLDQEKKVITDTQQSLSDIQSKINFYKIHERVQGTLDNFLAFINNKVIGNISVSQEYGMIVPNRQDIMRQQLVFPLLCWLLFRSFPTKDEMKKMPDYNYNLLKQDFSDEKDFMIRVQSFLQNGTIYEHENALKRLNEHHIKRKLLISYKIYMTIKEVIQIVIQQQICSFNSENQLCLVKFINILQQHIGFGEEVIETLISGFANNEKILQSLAQIEISQVHRQESQITAEDTQISQTQQGKSQDGKTQDGEINVKVTQNLLEGLIYKILDFPSFSRPDIIRFLSNVCYYNDDPLFINQDMILRCLVQDEKFCAKALMKITFQKGLDLYLEYNDLNQQVYHKTLPEFLEQYLEQREQKGTLTSQYCYLINQLDLYANLCLNRNMVACEIFGKIFDLQILKKYVLSDNLENDLRAVFQKLIRTLYIDREPFEIIKLPKLVRIINYDHKILVADEIIEQDNILCFKLKQKRRPRVEMSKGLNSVQQTLLNSPTPTRQKGSSFYKYNILQQPEYEILNQTEEEDLKTFLLQFKHDLLENIEIKYNLMRQTKSKVNVYDVLTFEIIKMLELILKFGLFAQVLEKPIPLKKPKSKAHAEIFLRNDQRRIKEFNEQIKQSDIEKLINYLAYFLEYDENYFNAMVSVQLQRKHVEQKKNREELQRQETSNLLKSIGGKIKLENFTSLFEQEGNIDQEEKVIGVVVNESEITDPLFKKIKSLKKVLQKSTNKTFEIKDDTDMINYEVLIKIQICKIFSYLFDIRQDYLIDNLLSFFQTIYVPKVVNFIGDKKDIDWTEHFLSLLPEDQLQVGKEFQNIEMQSQYTNNLPTVRNLDYIVERPFYETLIFALYFSTDSKLQNEIVDLIQRYSFQKEEFQQNVKNLQLMIAPEVIEFYKDWNAILQKMKISILKCQQWLQVGTPSSSNQQNEKDMNDSIILLEDIKKRFNKNILDTRAIKTKQKIFMHVGAFDNLLLLLLNCQRLIDTQPKVFNYLENDDPTLFYPIQLGKSVIYIMLLILDILSIFYRNNFQNQMIVQNKIVNIIAPYIHNNFGQVAFIIELYRENPRILHQINSKVLFKFVMELIKKHGQYPEFLEVFLIILSSVEDLESTSELPKKLLACLIDQQCIGQINPFGDSIHQMEEFNQLHNTGFYTFKSNLENYKIMFLLIIAKCLRVEISVNQIQNVKVYLKMKDLLLFLIDRSRDQVNDTTASLQFNKLLIKSAIIDIILILIDKIGGSLGDLTAQGPLVQQFLELEILQLEEKTLFNQHFEDYLFKKQIPIILKYIEAYFQDAQTQIFGANENQRRDRKRLFTYGSLFFKKMSLMKSKGLIDDPSIRQQLKRLCSVLNRDLMPAYLQNSNDQKEQIVDAQEDFLEQGQIQLTILNDDVIHNQFDARQLEAHHDEKEEKQTHFVEIQKTRKIRTISQKFRSKFKKNKTIDTEKGREYVLDENSKKMMDHWTQFCKLFTEGNKIKDILKAETSTFSQSLWRVNQMFQLEVGGEQSDLLLNSEDIILKLLYFIQYWQQNRVEKKKVIFVLQVLYKILKTQKNDLKELQQRQNMFDKLNCTKILMTLLWNENEIDHEYLKYILKLFNMLLHNGNRQVQKTIYDYVKTYSDCEKFFYKIHTIITSSISLEEDSTQVRCIRKTLRLIQLLCQGHNQDLQDYLHQQKNSKNNYDIVTVCVKLLTNIKINPLNLKISLQCLDTIIETIQGPCRNNQITVSNSKFLEYAVNILSEEKVFEVRKPVKIIYESKEVQQQKDSKKHLLNVLMDQKAGHKFKKLQGLQKVMKQENELKDKRFKIMNQEETSYILIHPGMLAKLKYKSLVCMVGLLEASDSGDSLMQRIILKIPLKVLTENLLHIFKLYEIYISKDQYEQSLFCRQDQILDTTKDDDYYELIIEQGFLIYALMQMFLNDKKGRDVLFEDVEMRDILNIFIEAKHVNKSIFGQLGKLSGLMKSQMSNLKQGFDDLTQKSIEEKKKEQDIINKKKNKELLIKAIKFFQFNTKSIEINREDKLYTVYFPKLPFCHMLPKDLKEEFHDTVVRTSSKSKLTQLMLNSEKFIRTMRHEERLRILFNYSPILGFFADNGLLWENLSFANVIIINLIVCASYSQYFLVNDESTGLSQISSFTTTVSYERLRDPRFLYKKELNNTYQVILIFGLLELVLASLIVFFFMLKRAPLKIQGIWEGFDFSNQSFFRTIFQATFKMFKSVFVLLQDFDILYYTLYIAAGIIGLTVHPFLFAILLMDFFKLDNLKTVVQAIWKPRVELGLVLMLLLIFEYYFTIIAWIFFYLDYDPQFYVNGPNYDDTSFTFCTDFWMCYVQTFNWTFKFTGSIGTHLRDPRTVDLQNIDISAYDQVDQRLVSHLIARFVFDNMFNICLVFVLTNMIQGIIIDTFGALREKLDERVQDQQQKCFVCGLDMEKLDKNSDSDKGFKYHIVVEHYMWNYLFYRAYIEQKKPLECDGNETYVLNKLKNKDLNWFPIGRFKIFIIQELNASQMRKMRNKSRIIQ